jgi:hypothetical protein
MAENGRKDPPGSAGEFVGMADAGGQDFDQHLAAARTRDVDGFQAEQLAGLAGDGGTDFPASFSHRGGAGNPQQAGGGRTNQRKGSRLLRIRCIRRAAASRRTVLPMLWSACPRWQRHRFPIGWSP